MQFADLLTFFYFLRMTPAMFDQSVWRNVLRIRKTNTNLRKSQNLLHKVASAVRFLACCDKYPSLKYNTRVAKPSPCRSI